jgi:elongation factor G
VPQTELVRYSVDLRSSTHGSGSFTRSFGHYEAMPEDVARSILTREG